jgi:hypothetical protein
MKNTLLSAAATAALECYRTVAAQKKAKVWQRCRHKCQASLLQLSYIDALVKHLPGIQC